jgi:hypothetical protein
MNFKEIVEALKTLKTDEGQWSHQVTDVTDLYQNILDATEPTPLPNGIGEYKVIVSEGSTVEGYYSERDEYGGPFVRVFYFVDHNVYIK